MSFWTITSAGRARELSAAAWSKLVDPNAFSVKGNAPFIPLRTHQRNEPAFNQSTITSMRGMANLMSIRGRTRECVWMTLLG